jgi:hypothetical protein
MYRTSGPSCMGSRIGNDMDSYSNRGQDIGNLD